MKTLIGRDAISEPDSAPDDASDQEYLRKTGVHRLVLNILLCLLLLVPVGVAVFAIACFERAPIENLEREPIAFFSPKEAELYGEKESQITLSWGAGKSLFAPSWSGLVTGLSVNVGDTISSYDKVAEIDGISRLAWRTNRPFTRALQSGDRGKDVTDLQRALKDIGVLKAKPTGRMGRETVRAVKAYSRMIGYSDEQSEFDPSWIIFLPSKSFKVASIHLAIGKPAPTLGASIFESPASPIAALVSTTEESDLPTPVTNWEVVVDGQGYPYGKDGSIAKKHLEPITAFAGIANNDSDTATDPEGALTAKHTSIVKAIIRRVKPVKVHRVPTISVTVGADGRHCVWVINGSKEASPPDVAVVYSELLPERSDLGISLLTDLPAGLLLVSNPRTALGVVSCP